MREQPAFCPFRVLRPGRQRAVAAAAESIRHRGAAQGIETASAMVVIVGAADGLRYVVEKVDGAEKRLRDPSAGSVPPSQ